MTAKSIQEMLLSLLYPHKCLVCFDIIPDAPERLFCEECSPKIKLIDDWQLCENCGRPCASRLCATCAERTFRFAKNRSAAMYNEAMQDMIYRFKYGRRPEYGRGLGRLMASLFNEFFDENIDLIVPVPLHRKRLAKRGFNQSELLAAEIAKAAGLPMAKKALRRIVNTKPQSELGPAARLRNVGHAFVFNGYIDISGKNILLVDDIFTTGSTLSACAAVLLNNGAGNVYCYTLSIAL